MQEEHRQTVDALRNQLEVAELEIDRLHASRVAAAASSMAAVVPFSPDMRDLTPDYPRELRVEERQSGEVCDLTTNYNTLDTLCYKLMWFKIFGRGFS